MNTPMTLDKSGIANIEDSPIAIASITIPVVTDAVAGLRITIDVDPNILLASMNATGKPWSMSDVAGAAYDAAIEVAERLQLSA